jgi:hypothetical protein
VLSFGAFYLARLALSLSLPDLPLSVPAWYFPLTGAIWGGMALVLGVGLLRGERWARRFTLWIGPIYWLWYWSDRLLLVHTDFAQRSLPAALVLSTGAVVLLLWGLTRPAARAFFEERPDG